jgi:hypothetical protein
MKTKILIKIIFLFLIYLYSYATVQIPDKIIINGEKQNLNYRYPLEKFFEKNYEKKPRPSSSALWRGYIGTFEVIENQLYVIDIEIRESSFKLKSIMNEIFPNQQKVKVEWFSGLLLVTYGELINDKCICYEKYSLFEINVGDIIKERNFKAKEFNIFKERQFLKFKQTEKYNEIKESLNGSNSNEESKDRFVKLYNITNGDKILDDSEIKTENNPSLVGIWEGSEKDNQVNGMEKKWTMDRKENGTFIIKFETKIKGKKNTTTEYGTWWTEGNKFFEYHEDTGLTDEYIYEILNKKQVKFIMKSTDIDFNKPNYIFIDTKVKK